MKNLKKVVALVLAFAMVLSMGTVAFAAENATEADALYNLGLLKGYSTTEKVLGLDDAADAQQAIKLIGVALGWEVDAEATVAFTDVADWAVPYVAKAVELGVTNGVSATEFGTEVDGKRMVTWLLRALGYDSAEAWDNTDTLAETAGLTVPTTSLRDDVVGVIYDALMASKVDSDTTLLDDLIAAGTVTEADAIAEGLKEAAPEEFAIVSVEPFGLRAVKITFTSDIDDDETMEVTEDGDDVVADKYSADGSVLVVTFTANADQTEELDLTITATGKDEVKVDEEEVSVVMADKVDPELVSVTVDNAKTIKVKYNEPIDPASFEGPGVAVFDDVKIGDAKVVGEVEQSDDKTELTYKLNTALEANTYEFTMEEVADYAGFKAPASTTTITVVADDAAPVLVSVEAKSTTEVVLTFDEDVASIGKVEIDGIEYEEDADADTEDEVTIDGDEVTVDITSNPLVAGDAFVAVKGDYSDAKDVLDNESDDDIEFTFLAPFDDEVPTATLKVTEDNYIAVIFSEEVTGFVVGDVTVKDGDDEETVTALLTDETVSKDYEDEDADDKIYLIDLDAAGQDVNETEYVVEIDGEGIVDGSVLENELADIEVTVTMMDVKDPSFVGDFTVVDNSANEEVLRISFDEAMNESTLSDITNYILDGNPLKETDDVVIDVADDAKSVDIDIPDTDLAGLVLELFGVEDVAGNSLADNDDTIVDAAANFDDITAKFTALDTIEITSAGHEFTIADPDDFELYDGAQEVTSLYVTSAVVDEDDADKLILTLSKELKPDVTTANGTALTLKVVEGDTVDTNDVPLVVATEAIVDEVSVTPEIEEGDTVITITFDEEVEAASDAAIVNDIIVYDTEDEVTLTLTVGGNVTLTGEDGNNTGFNKITITGLTNDRDYEVELISRNITDVSAAANVVNGVAKDTYTPAE